MGDLDYQYKVNKLIELLKLEHGDCHETTCSISNCMNNGFELWAIYLFSSTGASSEDFNNLYNRLPSQFKVEAESERLEFINSIPSVQCPHCDAIVYSPEDHDYYCSNCTKQALFKVKLNCGASDGIVNSGTSNWVYGFNVVKEKELDSYVIYSVAMKHGKNKSDFTKSILEESIGSETPTDSKMEFID